MKYYAGDCATSTPAGSGLVERRLQRQRRRPRGRDRGRRQRPDAAQRLEQLGLRRRRRVGRRRPVPARGGEQLRARGRGRDDLLLLDRRLRARTSRAIRPTAPYVVSVGGTSTYSTSNPGDVEHAHDVERRRQLVLERHRPAVVADRPRRHGERAVPGPRDPGRVGRRRPEHRDPLRRQHEPRPAAPRAARSAARASRRR